MATERYRAFAINIFGVTTQRTSTKPLGWILTLPTPHYGATMNRALFEPPPHQWLFPRLYWYL
jgi:hypothetical protein